MQNPVESFGTALRAARKKQNLTQKALAEKLGMSVRTIIQAEQGYSNPQFETVAILTQSFFRIQQSLRFLNMLWISFLVRQNQIFKNTFYCVNRRIPSNQNDILSLH